MRKKKKNWLVIFLFLYFFGGVGGCLAGWYGQMWLDNIKIAKVKNGLR